ncbi:hypothetical protein C8F04DRAFT_1320711 [Mycena alexandri]|uniref:Uncharacterized protein n=1 Tax=Mycena alexandri TaxID=1745969 RepID=A0AAD6WQG9_9AGAR|nr:hypothetical protein C8F04DRAFT_1320711 [Mycena alexandri]
MNHSRRKSMRLAADPCLGFYVMPTSNPPISRPPAADLDVPAIAVLDSDGSTDDSEEPVVSVDAFLRRSALTRTKTYAKKSRRTTQSANEESANPPRIELYPANNTHHQSKSLRSRILRAAVLSHADPDEFLLQDDSTAHSRNPLTFVEGPHPSREPVQTKRRTWSLSHQSTSPKYEKKHFEWMAGTNLSGRILVESPKPREIIVQSAKLARIPLQLRSHRHYPSSPAQPLLELSELQISPTPRMSTTPTDLSETPAFAQNPSADDPMPPAITLPVPNSSPTPATSSPAPALTSLSHRESQQTANSTLKPLASFFDQFLQTARVETQLEKNQKKKAPRKSVRRNPVNAPQPIGALKSFLRNSVRQTSSAQPFARPSSNYPLSSYLPNAPVPSFDMQFRVPSIPDSHRVIQATSYQVVLPSTPPTSAQAMLHTTPTYCNDHDMSLGAVDSSVDLFCLHARVCAQYARIQSASMQMLCET